ncbi:hypothetical protein ACFX1Z_024313 [Malus domestica]
MRGVEDIMVISIGSSQFLEEARYKYEQVKNWQAKEWARPMARITGDGSVDLVDQSVAMAFELWLISWSKDQNPDFSQEVSLKLGPDGKLGNFIGPSGKEYDLQSTAQKPDATVFVSFVSGTKVDRNARVGDELPRC